MLLMAPSDMVAHSGRLVSAAEDALSAAAAAARPAFNDALSRLYDSYRRVGIVFVFCLIEHIHSTSQVNLSMETMWGCSKPA